MFKSFLNELKDLFKNKWVGCATLLVIILPFAFAFLQISSNWNPFNSVKNLNIGIVDFDNSTLSKQSVKGIIKTDSNLKFNGSNQKYNIKVNEIYLDNPNDIQNLLNNGSYDAIYKIPKDYQSNQINYFSNLLSTKIKSINTEMDTPNFLKNNPSLEKIIFHGFNNFINNMYKQVKGTAATKTSPKIDPIPLNSNQKVLFDLLNFFVRNSRVNPDVEELLSGKGVDISYFQTIDKSLTNLTNLLYNDQEFTLSQLISFVWKHGGTLFPVANFWKNMHYKDLIYPLINGLISSLLSTNVIQTQQSKMINSKPNGLIKLYLSTQNSPLTSELTHMLTNSPDLVNNMFTHNILKMLSTNIIGNVRNEVRTLIGSTFQNLNNLILGTKSEKGIIPTMYPTGGAEISVMLKPILDPLTNPTFLWPSLDNALSDILANNIDNFNFNISDLIQYKAIGNPNKTLGQIIAPNLMAFAMWLSLLAFVFIAKNKRVKGNKNNTTIKNYFSKIFVYIFIGLIQMFLMLIPLLLYGIASGSIAWYLLIYGFIIQIILAIIVASISFISKTELSIILGIFLLLSIFTIAYGIFPLELESKWYSWINYLSPTKYVIDGFRSIFNSKGFSYLILSILPLFAFLIIIPISLIINIKYDNKSLKEHGTYIDFSDEILEEE